MRMGTGNKYGTLFFILAVCITQSVSGSTERGFGGDEAGERWVRSTIPLPLLWCPPGKFRMGSKEDEAGRRDDEKLREIEITGGFFIGETEVTQGQWERVMKTTQSDQVKKMLADSGQYELGKTKETMSDYYRDLYGPDFERTLQNSEESPNHPIRFVAQHEAKDFCTRLTVIDRESGKIPEGWSYRLPTEAEWEYACRAGTDKATYGGDLTIKAINHAPELDAICWYGGNSSVDYPALKGIGAAWEGKQYPGGRAGPREVGSKNANAWGLKDTLGNVFEWCEDGYADYDLDARRDPTMPFGKFRVVRGGAWSTIAAQCRAAGRRAEMPNVRHATVGFRVVLAPGG